MLLIVQALVLVGVAMAAFGSRPDPLGLVLSVLLISVMAAGLASASYALGLWAKQESTPASVLNSVSVPIMLLSGILLPMSVGPTWLQNIAKANPFSHTVDASGGGRRTGGRAAGLPRRARLRLPLA